MPTLVQQRRSVFFSFLLQMSSQALLPSSLKLTSPLSFALNQFSRSDLKGETIESQVEGLAARITAEDEARRTEELVRSALASFLHPPCDLFGLYSAFTEPVIRT